MRALEIACNNVMLGKTDIGLVVGVENMTQAPFMLPKARMGYRMGGIPTEGGAELFDSLIHDALYDALVPGHMGVTADNVAKLCNVSRQECDELAVISHNRACAAIDAGVYLLSVIDAYVDAQLSVFDITPDLSLRIEPAVIETPGTKKNGAYGVGCSFNF